MARLFLACLVFGTCMPVQAAVIVTNCTQAALVAAMASGGVVRFSCDGTIILTQTISVSVDTTLDANGRAVRIDGNRVIRLFSVSNRVVFALHNLTLANGRMQGTNANGASDGESAFGAAIYSRGRCEINDCVLTNNVVQGGGGGTNGGDGCGGAIFSDGGMLQVINTTFVDNAALGGAGGNASMTKSGKALGGGVYLSGGAAEFLNSRFDRNKVRSGTNGVDPSNLTSGLIGDSSGGAVYVNGSESRWVGCAFRCNSVEVPHGGNSGGKGTGGAIHQSAGVAFVSGTLWQSNSVVGGLAGGARLGSPSGGDGVGGAIWNGGFLTTSNCQWIGNQATGGPAFGGSPGLDQPGAGLAGAFFNAGTSTIVNCLIWRNVAQGGEGFSNGRVGAGGGLYNGGLLLTTNNTILHNLALGGNCSAQFFRAGAGLGGGLFNESGSALLAHASMVSNTAAGGAGGFGTVGPAQGGSVFVTNGMVILQNSIFAFSTPTNAYGVFSDGGGNISSDGSSAFSGSSSRNDLDPLLAPLGDFGGPTWTMALLAGSPALDSAEASCCPIVDQRGRTRPFGPGCDVGAFESSPPYSVRGTYGPYHPLAGITISAANYTTNSAPESTFVLSGLQSGTYEIVPSETQTVFVPGSRLVTVGPDIINLHFDSYRKNALWIGRAGNNFLRLVYAGASGEIHRLEQSTDLGSWRSHSTNTVGNSNIFEIEEANIGSAEVFRTLRLQP